MHNKQQKKCINDDCACLMLTLIDLYICKIIFILTQKFGLSVCVWVYILFLIFKKFL